MHWRNRKNIETEAYYIYSTLSGSVCIGEIGRTLKQKLIIFIGL